MLVIRLQRTGRRNSPAYRIVVAEKTAPVKGRSIEIIGHYLPTRDPAVVECDGEKATAWIQKGAVPSDTVARLLAQQNVKGMEKFISSYSKKRPKKEPEPVPEPKAPPPPPPVAEVAPEPEAAPETPAEPVVEEPKAEEAPAEPAAEAPKEDAPEPEAPAEEKAADKPEEAVADDKKEE